MKNDIGNYARHAQFWDWGGYDRTAEHEYWLKYAEKFGKNVLIPMCAIGETAAYMARRGFSVTALDITPEMIAEGRRRFGGTENLRFFEADIRDFRIDMPPADFCFVVDFGHIHEMEEIKRALVSINTHLRDGGCLVIKAGLRSPEDKSFCSPTETFYPLSQVYPDMKVWKTGVTRIDAETGRFYISQTFYAEDENGHVDTFDHAFYLQSYFREEWRSAFAECGFIVAREEDDIFELVKDAQAKKRYSPAITLDYLQTPIYRYENVALYNDKINLEQPGSGYHQFYRFDINADGHWVGFIHVWIGYSIRIHYCGQIGYGIDEPFRNRGYATKACLALRPFLRRCGFKYVTITTDAENTASRRVAEKIGGALLEVVDTPTWTGMYESGQRKTCIYEWHVGEAIAKPDVRHTRIDLKTDREMMLEYHCRTNYECDTPWARKQPYDGYRANWFANADQQNGFLSALQDSMRDARTIAEIIKTAAGEVIGYLWMPFHGEDASFVWADVQDIYIEERFRRGGMAAYLMDYAEKSAKESGAMVIRSGTGIENIASQGLHSKLGFQQYRLEYEKVLRDDL